jgi:hypothetical protein
MPITCKVDFEKDDLTRVRLLRRGANPAAESRNEKPSPLKTAIWKGASGRRYAHTVYSLIECPPLPEATYVLVKRLDGGQRQVLHVGVVASEAPIYNLAGVRRRGARLGADEVHVHLHPKGLRSRTRIARDLRAGNAKSAN